MKKSTLALLLFGGLLSLEVGAQTIVPTSEKALQESINKHSALLSSSPLASFKAKNVGPTFLALNEAKGEEESKELCLFMDS